MTAAPVRLPPFWWALVSLSLLWMLLGICSS